MSPPGPYKALEQAILTWLHDHYPFWERGQKLPDGLRLEMSNAAFHQIITDPAAWEYDPAGPAMPYLSRLNRKSPVPVRISDELEPGCWRLVTVTEEEHLGGKL